jgi:hypothetical protein
VTAPGEWLHIAGDAWELYGTGVHYTLHKESSEWVARRFWLSQGGDETKDAEEPASTIDEAKRIVHRWECQE